MCLANKKTVDWRKKAERCHFILLFDMKLIWQENFWVSLIGENGDIMLALAKKSDDEGKWVPLKQRKMDKTRHGTIETWIIVNSSSVLVWFAFGRLNSSRRPRHREWETHTHTHTYRPNFYVQFLMASLNVMFVFLLPYFHSIVHLHHLFFCTSFIMLLRRCFLFALP